MPVTSSDGGRKKTQVTLTNTKTHVALSHARTVVQPVGATLPFPVEDALDGQVDAVAPSTAARAVP